MVIITHTTEIAFQNVYLYAINRAVNLYASVFVLADESVFGSKKAGKFHGAGRSIRGKYMIDECPHILGFVPSLCSLPFRR